MRKLNNQKLFTLLILVISTVLVNAHDFEEDGIYYLILNDNEVSVTYRGSSYYEYAEYVGAAVIPSTVTINGTTYSVTSIGELAFCGCSGLTSIDIPNSVTSIGNSAFQDCSGLTNIDIPNSVTSIGDEAFTFCSGLTSVTIPNSVTYIGVFAFRGCSGLTCITVESDNQIYDSRDNSNAIIETATNTLIVGCQNTTIFNTITAIGDYAFYGCRCLTDITIPNSVTAIGDGAFEDCSDLINIEISNSTTNIGGYAFDGTAWFDSQPNGVVYLGLVAYKYKGTMSYGTQITLRDGTIGIASYAFSSCTQLSSVTIPNTVTAIGNSAFQGCI